MNISAESFERKITITMTEKEAEILLEALRHIIGSPSGVFATLRNGLEQINVNRSGHPSYGTINFRNN